MHSHWWIVLAVAGWLAAAAAAADHGITYPATRRVEPPDDYHATKLADPYRWLEDDVRTSPEVAAWVADENKVTDAYLKAIPERPAIIKRLTELWNYEKHSVPHKEGGRYF